jgi:plasmid stabilization system protein ParE
MASKPVLFHPEADQEYLSSLAWYQERSLTAALNFESEFQRAIGQIAEAPERWPVYFSGCRRYVLHQFPFFIVYRVFPSEVFVLAVVHGHRRPGYWQGRLKMQPRQ